MVVVFIFVVLASRFDLSFSDSFFLVALRVLLTTLGMVTTRPGNGWQTDEWVHGATMSSEQISVMSIGSCKNTRCSLQMQLFRVQTSSKLNQGQEQRMSPINPTRHHRVSQPTRPLAVSSDPSLFPHNFHNGE